MARTYARGAGGRFAKVEKPKAETKKKAAPTARVRKAQPAEDLPEEEDEGDDNAEGETLRTDLGPWIESPRSSRVSAFRYDYMKRETQVTWRNNGNPGYAYMGMDYEAFRRFARTVSKGKYINSTLEGYGGFRRLDVDEVNAPSNPKRRGVSRSVA